MQHLVLGGARSGKSHYAEQLALTSHKEVIYIATGSAGDDPRFSSIAFWIMCDQYLETLPYPGV